MPSKDCVRRLQKEFKSLTDNPIPHVLARPLAKNILEWHFVLEGSPGTPFEGGVYWGKLTFPPDYPFKPPAITVRTPNGRFVPDAQICTSMSNFHPESWNPLWSVGSILNGLLSFMSETCPSTGCKNSTNSEKRRLAAESLQINCENPKFKELFPEYVSLYHKRSISKKTAPESNGGNSQVEQVIGVFFLGAAVIVAWLAIMFSLKTIAKSK